MNVKTHLSTDEYLNTIGEIGSTKRLNVIASLDLGERSEAAKRVCEKRWQRLEYMEKGLSYEDSVLLVSRNNN